MKDKFFLVLGIMIILGSFYLFIQKPAPEYHQFTPLIRIGDQTIAVEIADSEEERNLGLSGRESMPSGSRLLFIFNLSGKYGFWMKDMYFPIDIVWIDESWQVIGVERNLDPDTYPQV